MLWSIPVLKLVLSLKVMNLSSSRLLLMREFVSFEKLNDVPSHVCIPQIHVLSSVNDVPSCVYIPQFHVLSSVNVCLGL